MGKVVSAIITLFNCRTSARIAKGVVACHDGALAGLWSPTHTILCADGTSNTVGDLGQGEREKVLFLVPANGNWGRVGKGSRYSSGAFIRPTA